MSCRLKKVGNWSEKSEMRSGLLHMFVGGLCSIVAVGMNASKKR